MTPSAQRIAIAEACPSSFWVYVSPITGRKAPFRIWDLPSQGDHEVEFLTDLNAMNEAEEVLTADQQKDYAFRLSQRKHAPYECLTDDFEMLHATAAQRAEAFLRTIGKWVPS